MKNADETICPPDEAAKVEGSGVSLGSNGDLRSLDGLCYSRRQGVWHRWMCTSGDGWRHMDAATWAKQ